MEKKNKTLLYVVGVLLVIGVGISLAYFAAAILTRGNGAVTNVKTANIGDTTIVTEGNVEFTDTDIYPGHKNISKIKITATGQGDVTYHLIWKGENTLQTSLNYTLYKSSTDENPSVTCTKKSQGNLVKILYEECTNSGFENLEQLATGSIATTTSETTFRLKEDESITATTSGTVVYYYVVLEFPNVESSQNFDANGRFEGETNIEVPDAGDPDVGTSVDELIAGLDVKEGTPDFSQVAIGTGEETTDTNNGIFKVADGMYGGDSYYWRGQAPTNHVIFDNKCWRIVRINGDKSIRVIYNGPLLSGNVCKGNESNDESVALSGVKYNTLADEGSYVGWTYDIGKQRPVNGTTTGTDSTIKVELEKWYDSHIIDKSKVVTGKFCNDRNTKDNEPWVPSGTSIQFYAAYERLVNGREPNLECSTDDIYELNVGLVTADEVQFAGASGSSSGNTAYYLYNNYPCWTMTPYVRNTTHACVAVIGADGTLGGAPVLHTSYSIRPVINLRSDVNFDTGGNGTADNPYIVQI